jgi:hypothetical protein
VTPAEGVREPGRDGGLHGTLMVCGTTSAAGTSTLTIGLCRLLARRGGAVAPFKGLNMSLNATVAADGGETGRAQRVQGQIDRVADACDECLDTEGLWRLVGEGVVSPRARPA